MTARSMARQPARQPKKKNSKKTRFQILYSKVDALSKENEQLDADLNQVVQRVQRETCEVELDLGKTIRKVLDRQLDFALKKTLLQWQRAELDDWIDAHFMHLQAMGMLDDALYDKIALVRAFQLGITLDSDSELSPSEQLDNHFAEEASKLFEQADLSEERYEEVGDRENAHDGDASNANCEIDMDDWNQDDIEFDDVFTDGASSEDTKGLDTGTANPIIGDVFKRLFRQTARALHPDKEVDEQRQVEKNALMSELLKARKEFDLITVLRLHEQHAQASSELSAWKTSCWKTITNC